MAGNQFTTADIVARATYQTAADLTLKFEPDGWLFELVGGSADCVVFVSFDGVTDHMIMRAGKTSAAKSRATKAKSVWLRCVGGAAGTVIVDIEAGTAI